MSIYFGNDTVNDLYIGLTPVSKGYVGTHLFYNGDNTIIDFTYEKYILNTQFSTLYNTEEIPVKSAILKGDTKYRDIDTGDILDTFDETKNLELVSVKMPVLNTTGKNLFDKTKIRNNYAFSENNVVPNTGWFVSSYITVQPNTDYKLIKTSRVHIYDENKTLIEYPKPTDGIFTTPTNASFIRINGKLAELDIWQVEKGSVTTEYEPYKSNILTVNDEVELRGIGNVKDELDLLTGELTQRVGEVVLDGSQDGVYDYASNESTGILVLRLPKIPDIINTGANVYGLRSDKYASATSRSPDNILSYNGRIMVTKPLSELESFNTADKIKSFLSQDPITLQYLLATPVSKTVDLSVVDQDGNGTELSTFNDITHVTLSSEGLIPEAELEVATKNEEVLNTMSLEMDDISATQTTLEETSNIQSENVDATMIATTEIYEGLL